VGKWNNKVERKNGVFAVTIEHLRLLYLPKGSDARQME